MLRQPLRSVRAPVKAFDLPYQQAAWKGAWRKLFVSQTKARLPNQLLKWRTASWEGVLSASRSSRFGSPNMLQGVLRRGFRFSTRRKTKGPGATEAEETLSLTARLKKLTKEYGWATVGIYFGLSILDFPFCFLFVRAVGTDRIGTWK